MHASTPLLHVLVFRCTPTRNTAASYPYIVCGVKAALLLLPGMLLLSPKKKRSETAPM